MPLGSTLLHIPSVATTFIEVCEWLRGEIGKLFDSVTHDLSRLFILLLFCFYFLASFFDESRWKFDPGFSFSASFSVNLLIYIRSRYCSCRWFFLELLIFSKNKHVKGKDPPPRTTVLGEEISLIFWFALYNGRDDDIVAVKCFIVFFTKWSNDHGLFLRDIIFAKRVNRLCLPTCLSVCRFVGLLNCQAVCRFVCQFWTASSSFIKQQLADQD